MEQNKPTPESELAEAIAKLAELNHATAADLNELTPEERETFRQMDAMRTYYASEN